MYDGIMESWDEIRIDFGGNFNIIYRNVRITGGYMSSCKPTRTNLLTRTGLCEI